MKDIFINGGTERLSLSKEFEKFMATKPTPSEFKNHYPNVRLVLPGSITTQEFRMDDSRYHAILDGEGRIIGGHFR